jgi:hypothetical protein
LEYASEFLRERLAILEAVRNDTERERLDAGARCRVTLAVGENARQSGDFRDPAAIVFAFAFDLQHDRNLSALT